MIRTLCNVALCIGLGLALSYGLLIGALWQSALPFINTTIGG